MNRRVDERPIRNIVYMEDLIRNHYHLTYPEVQRDDREKYINLTEGWEAQKDNRIIDK